MSYTDRTVIEVTGAEHAHFLNGLVTNALPDPGGISYGALLTPQGKYLFDFFMIARPDTVWLDIAADRASALVQRLTMYKLRADVTLRATDITVSCGIEEAPDGALPDPRHEALGWRLYGDTPVVGAEVDWDALRVAHCIPATGSELSEDSYILEAGFERLHGVDFRKGCYVGQEVTARMKHKTELRKGFTTVSVQGDAAPGTPITADGKAVGTLHTRAGDRAIAYLRFDRAKGPMQAADATVTWNG